MQLKLILCASLYVLCLFGLKAQATIYVAPNGSGNGSSWQNPSSIQDAIINAVANDTIKLKEGTYTITATLEIDKTLFIHGGYSGFGNTNNPKVHKSILDGGSHVSILSMEYSSKESIINGVYFENGFGSNSAGALSIYGQDVKVRNCVFRNNTSKSTIGSGAIYIRANNILIQNSRFEGNRVIQSGDPNNVTGGGAIHIRHIDNTIIKNCKFINNMSYYPGGAISSWGPNSKIENCSFKNNHSKSIGGAIYKSFDDLTVENSVFQGNTADVDGGDIYNNNDPLNVINTIFRDNKAEYNAGGLYLKASEAYLSRVIFDNNQAMLKGGGMYTNFDMVKIVDAQFWNNKAGEGGGAIYNEGEMELSNINFIGNNNTAFFVSSDSSSKIYNSIFYNNTAIQSQTDANSDIEVQNIGSTIYLIL